MNFVAVDPGVTAGCACAYFEGWGGVARLARTTFLRPGAERLSLWTFDQPGGGSVLDFVIVECPQADGRSLNARPKDLMDLSWDGAAVAYSFGVQVWEVSPDEWKGAVPKPVHHMRMWNRLDRAERAILPPDTADQIKRAADKGAKDRWAKPGAEYYPRPPRPYRPGPWDIHNILDAVGLGVYAREHPDRRR